ncbi:MAG: cation:proton antiporter, partial [Betaproteobacteria bacterium]|nr:cation:proton antiporter [Betaproteobacteria bacterium]
LAGSAVDRLPLSPGLIYLLIGVALGPAGLGIVTLDPMSRSPELLLVCEIAVIISLFTVGLKLRTALSDPLWRLPLRLATISMAVVIGAVTLVGYFGFGLPLGGAVLLGAILAPTDPVLASDVQVRHADDRDRSRFALTAEGGFNDGIAFPFVILGLGLMGLGELGPFGVRWIAIDLVWAIAAGLAIGWLCGKAVGHVVLFIRREFREAVGWDDFLALGLIGLTYGLALLVHAYGFLAVLAAGLAMRHIETIANDNQEKKVTPSVAKSEEPTHPATAPAHMVKTVLGFNERFERIGELVVVLALGASLSTVSLDHGGLWLALLLFVFIRPLSVLAGLAGAGCSRRELKLMSWFGIRGIGSLYYLMYAIEAGPPTELTEKLVSLVLTVVAASIAVHGISATPVMKRSKRGAG